MIFFTDNKHINKPVHITWYTVPRNTVYSTFGATRASGVAALL